MKVKAAQDTYEKLISDDLPKTHFLQKIEKDRNGSNLPLPSSSLLPPITPISLLNSNKNVNPTSMYTFNQPSRIVVPPLSLSSTPNQKDKTRLLSKERDSSSFRQWHPEVL